MKITWHKIKAYVDENFAAEQEQLTAWIPFMFAAGIALYFALPAEPNMWFSLGIFELWLLLFYLLRRKNLYLLFLSGLIFCLGFMNIQARTLYQNRRIENISEKSVTYLRGQIKNISRSEKAKSAYSYITLLILTSTLKGIFALQLCLHRKIYKSGNVSR